jgi:hypothetical protein
MSYHVGMTADGRVVHLYDNGTRIVLPKAKRTPGVSEAPAGQHDVLAPAAAAYSNANDNAAFMRNVEDAMVNAHQAAAKNPHDPAHDRARQAAVQAAYAHFLGQ